MQAAEEASIGINLRSKRLNRTRIHGIRSVLLDKFDRITICNYNYSMYIIKEEIIRLSKHSLSLIVIIELLCLDPDVSSRSKRSLCSAVSDI